MRGAKAEWKRFGGSQTTEGQTVDGRFLPSLAVSGDLVIFCPGFPGGGGTMYEQRHADQIAARDYNQIILRHNGTVLDGPHSDFLLNVSQYPGAVTHHHNGWIGGKPAGIADWLTEPQTVLEDVGFSYSNIYLLGHSFGGLAVLHSLCNLHEKGHKVLERVRAVALLAPALGTVEGDESENIMRIWSPEFLESPEVTEKVSLADDPVAIRQILWNTYRFLARRVSGLPGHIRLSFLHVTQDEYIRESDVRGFSEACGRGSVVLDPIDRPHTRGRGIATAHDMPDYPSELLIQLFEEPVGVAGFPLSSTTFTRKEK